MRNSAKGVLAAGAAVTLLVGGGGTLAYWNDIETFGGADIDTGSLNLGGIACGDWLLENNDVFTPGADAIVPGDTLTRSCSSTIVAEGEHLEAEVTVTGGGDTMPADLVAENVTFTSELTLDRDGTPVALDGATITSGDHGSTLTVTMTLAFPYGSSAINASMDEVVTIADWTVTATQKLHPPA